MVQCTAGVFFVVKKDDTLRLILDCRPVNQCCRPAPYSSLATPSHITGINLSDEWVRHCESESGIAAGDLDAMYGSLSVCGAGVDLQDGFYQFLAPTISSWFGLGEQFSAAEAE
eukprot:8201466-Karenia_brevis.AAC.1